MPNQIIPVVWEKPLRKSAVNTLDKLNEVIDFINTSDIHEFSFIDGDTGREVVSGTSTQLATLDVFGESVQDGTPTPENPVEVQVVKGVNLWDEQWELGRYDTSTGAAVTASDRIRCKNPINVLPSTDYCFTGADFVVYWYTATGEFISYATPDSGTVRTSPNNARMMRFNCVAAYGTTYNNDICINISNQAINGLYLPYGYIGLQIGNDITPIDLQGHVLASLPDGTQDLLRVDSAGVKGIEQYVGVVVFDGSEDESWGISGNNKRAYTRALQALIAPNSQPLTAIMCDKLAIANEIQTYNGQVAYGISANVNAATTSSQYGLIGLRCGLAEPYTIEAVRAWLAENPLTVYYQLAESQHVDLGVMDMPPIPSGSVIKIAATLEPEFNIQWWTESAIPSVINGLKAYIDEQIETVNARIDELHGITRASIVRPDVVIPAIEPIEKSTVDETETDTEKEI